MPEQSAEAPEPTPAEPVDELVTTHHTLATPDGPLEYTATTGVVAVPTRQTPGESPRSADTGLIGVTAYTLDGGGPARPLTFVFNGGPGSPSMWLHMGLVGPRVVDAGTPDSPATPPFTIVDNPHTLLRATDIVVIDAMSTGYSRAADGQKAAQWHGWKADVEQVAELIRIWCTRNDRWTSPLHLLGESYGTIRAVSVAERLQSAYGMYLAGIVLVSSVLDFGSQDFDNARWDEACTHFLPTYAAIAWYHGRHPGRSLEEVLGEAEEFADGPYRLALGKGRRLPAEDRARVEDRLARLTGLPVDYIRRADLRVEHLRFCTELLRDQGLVVGRIDGRFTGPARAGTDEMMDTDASDDATRGAFTAATQHYLRAELGSPSEREYVVSADLWKDWNYREFQGRPVNVTDKLERVMRAQPGLRVRIEYGRYDLATPYFAAQDMVDHLHLPEAAFNRIEHAYFETGHMPYLSMREREADEIVAFLTRG